MSKLKSEFGGYDGAIVSIERQNFENILLKIYNSNDKAKAQKLCTVNGYKNAKENIEKLEIIFLPQDLSISAKEKFKNVGELLKSYGFYNKISLRESNGKVFAKDESLLGKKIIKNMTIADKNKRYWEKDNNNFTISSSIEKYLDEIARKFFELTTKEKMFITDGDRSLEKQAQIMYKEKNNLSIYGKSGEYLTNFYKSLPSSFSESEKEKAFYTKVFFMVEKSGNPFKIDIPRHFQDLLTYKGKGVLFDPKETSGGFSDHVKHKKAVDIGLNSNKLSKSKASEFVAILNQQKRKFNIKEILFDKPMHYDHIHISFN